VDVQLGQIAYSAANAAAGAIATDGWGVFKGLLTRWFKHHRRAGSDDLIARLEESRKELLLARLDPDSEVFWKQYERIQAILTVGFAVVAAADAAAQEELKRLHAEWLALPGVSAQVAGSAEYLARVYGGLLEESWAAVGAPAVHRGPGSVPRRPIVGLVPPTTTRFTDREEVLDRLCPRIVRREDRIRILNLCGEGGIGKTALAVKLSELVGASFPDGRLYVDLRGSTGEGAVEPAAALERLLQAIQGEDARIPGGEQARQDSYRRLTDDLSLVILLDDAASLAQVRPLLSASPTALTIVTSRDPLPGLVQEFGATVVRVQPFDDANSLKLLRALTGLDDPLNPSAAKISASDLEAVIRGCAGLPLAVCIEAARLAVGNLDQVPEPQRPSAEPAAPDVLTGYRGLAPEAVRLHRLLCHRPWPSITAGPAAAAIGADAQTAGDLLARLCAVGLLDQAQGTTPERPRYCVPKRVREQALRLVRTPHDVGEAVAGTRAMVSWYLAFAVFADWEVNSRWRLGPRYEPLAQARDEAGRMDLPEPRRYSGEAAALAVLDKEFDNLVEAVQAAADQHLDALVPQLCEAMWGFFLMRGRFAECVAVHRLGVTAAAAAGELRMLARMHVQLAFGLLWQDEDAAAEREFESGLAADRDAGHDQGLATALESLGLVRLARQEFARAAELFREARIYAERVGDPRALALLHYHEGRALTGLGLLDEAEREFDLANATFVEKVRPRDPYNEGKVLMGRAQVALRAGRPEQAGELLDQVARVMADKGALVVQGQVSVLRAWCAQEMGDLAAERAFLVEAQDLYIRAGSQLAPRVLDRVRFLDSVNG
jgi:tetratricopeptide (TPR) repeat protein